MGKEAITDLADARKGSYLGKEAIYPMHTELEFIGLPIILAFIWLNPPAAVLPP